jgi:hypothetical protein
MRSSANRSKTKARRLKAWIYEGPDGKEVYRLTPEGKFLNDLPNAPVKRTIKPTPVSPPVQFPECIGPNPVKAECEPEIPQQVTGDDEFKLSLDSWEGFGLALDEGRFGFGLSDDWMDKL